MADQQQSGSRRQSVRAELVWDGKYGKDGRRVAPFRAALPFQTVETVNETAQERQKNLLFESSGSYAVKEWRNRLIWGDKKYVLPSLLPEFAGKVNLIYIDPPFDTGADFSFNASVPEHPDADEDDSVAFTKEPNIIEQKAYRDTWGRGLDSYLQWFYETVVVLHELLHENGSIYVHLDWHVGHYAKVILDEVFGAERFVNEVMWCYSIGGKGKTRFGRKHDTIFFYAKGDNYTFNGEDKYVIVERKANTHMRMKTDDTGREFQEKTDRKSGKVYRYYVDEGKIPEDYWTDIEQLNREDSERVGYDTQKPEALLRRVVAASSNAGDLILDCFAGSGTTATVAEKLQRRWITCDLGRFAIHTARKRLLSTPQVRPFMVQNLGKYERQLWQTGEFGKGDEAKAKGAAVQRSYTDFILKLYQAKPIHGYTWLHGVKSGRMIHVGAVDSPVTAGDVTQIAAEFKKAVGTGKGAPKTNGVDIVAWDFAFEMNEVAKQKAAAANIQVKFYRIPREVMDKRAAEQGDVHFFELGALAVDAKVKGREVELELSDFVIPPDDVPEDVRKAVKHWSQWIDYWAVDWDFKGDTFHNEWQTYRTRKDPKLELKGKHDYKEKGDYVVLVKVK